MTTDRLSGTVLALFAVVVIWESRVLPLGTFRQPGPAFVPILLALLLLTFGIFVGALDGMAPCRSDFDSICLFGFRHRASWLPPHRAARAGLSGQSRGEAGLGT